MHGANIQPISCWGACHYFQSSMPWHPLEKGGFRQNRNCSDQVLAHTEADFQRKKKASAACVELSSAYDTTLHRGLLHKLVTAIKCGKRSSFASMLTDRQFQAHLGEQKSRPLTLQHGLPQGSALTPILFNLYGRPYI